MSPSPPASSSALIRQPLSFAGPARRAIAEPSGRPRPVPVLPPAMLSQVRRRPVATRPARTRSPRRRPATQTDSPFHEPSRLAPRWIGLRLLADDDELRDVEAHGQPADRVVLLAARRLPARASRPGRRSVRPAAASVPEVGQRLQRRAHAVGVGVVRVVDDRDAVGRARHLHPPARPRSARDRSVVDHVDERHTEPEGDRSRCGSVGGLVLPDQRNDDVRALGACARARTPDGRRRRGCRSRHAHVGVASPPRT